MEILDLSKMTIREIESKIKHYELQLDYYLGVKEKMFGRTQPKPVDVSKEMVQGGKRSNVILDYVMSAEEIDIITDELQDEINRLIKYNDGLLRIMEEYEPIVRVIVRLRDENGYKWEVIARKVNYSLSHTRRLYKEAKDKQQISTFI